MTAGDYSAAEDRLLLSRLHNRLPISRGSLELHSPSGRRLRVQGQSAGPSAQITLHHPLRLLSRLMQRSDIGFAEGFIEGDWSSQDLVQLLRFGAANEDSMADMFRIGVLQRSLNLLRHLRRRNSRSGSRSNIASHYDLGNRFYAAWLDPGMTYSGAVYDSEQQSLKEAQENKYGILLDRLQAAPGSHILEIGCGWGGLALAAARRGHRVTAITLSTEQRDFCRRRMHEEGVADLVEVRLADYRELAGHYDHIVSIEMFEAVGERYWSRYFRTLHDRLSPGGRAAVQTITIDERKFDSYRRSPDFIQLYVFPGGMLPSPERFRNGAERAGLELSAAENYGHHYARTLRSWLDRFSSVDDEVAALGFDDRFRRLWRYYLAYCEAGFWSNRVDLWQFLLQRP